MIIIAGGDTLTHYSVVVRDNRDFLTKMIAFDEATVATEKSW